MAVKDDPGIKNDLLFYKAQLQNYYEIGKALSSEKDPLKLLDLIIDSSIDLTASDAGTIYLIIEAETGNPSYIKGNNRQGKVLKFAIAKNRSMDPHVAESVLEITPQSICGFTAITGLPLNIEDAYAIPVTAEYCHNKSYDSATGYITKSVLSIPMKTHEDKVMGIIQLINKKQTGFDTVNHDLNGLIEEIIPYNAADELVMTSLAGQAAVVLENNLLYRERERLLQSYIRQNKDLEILSRNVLKAHEEERRRIARDIHDGPAQSVANLSLEAELAKKYLETGNLEQVSDCLSKLNDNIKATAKEVRMIIYNLKPSYLDDGLLKALENHFQLFATNTGIDVQFSITQSELHLEYYLASTIYRIVQEAFTNIQRHANARKIVVDITYQKGNLLLAIVDDGRGFDPSLPANKAQAGSGSGFGLEGMRERVELIKGTMSIHSKPGEGTKIVLQIPLPEPI